jgi:ribosomal protein S18 acetylase RimI-like enzyme
VNGSIVGTGQPRATAEATRGWRLRPWPNDASARLVVFADHLTVPTPDELAAAIAATRADQAPVLRTSALFPRAAEAAVGAGFEVLDTLALLRRRLDDDLDRMLESIYGTDRPRTTALRSWHHRQAARVDQEAFGSLWGNDEVSLAEIRWATPIHRARRRRAGRRTAGFAISGAAGDSGYIQRLAVATDAQRRGVGRDLVADALRWMRRQSYATAYVNTGVDNHPALALYDRFGFDRLDDQLVIAEYRLPS